MSHHPPRKGYWSCHYRLATGRSCVLATTRSTYCQPQPVVSVPCLLLAFCVWMLFSAVAVNLPKVGFNFTTDQLFMLTALPSVSGALLRVPYSFMVPIFGGRRWTAFSTGILIIPCVWLGFAVQGYLHAL